MKMRSTGNDHAKKMHNYEVKKGFLESDFDLCSMHWYYMFDGVNF